MRKLAIALAMVGLLAGPALANQCPLLVKQIMDATAGKTDDASKKAVATASPSSFLMSLRPAGAGWRDDHSSQTSEWIRRETRPLSSRCNDHSSQPRDPLRTGTWISLRIRPYHHLRVPEQDRETRTWCVSW